MKTFLVAALLSSAFAAAADAAIIDLKPTGQTFAACGSCTTFEGRGIYFRADEAFSVSSIGWMGNIQSGTYNLTIQAGLGETAPLGATLLTVSQAKTGGTYGWNDFAAAFSFDAGQEYYLNLSKSDGQAFSTNYDYIGWGSGPQSSDIGLVTLLDGRHGINPAGDNNGWFTHFRFDAGPAAAEVPEPAMLGLFGLGALGLGLARRRRTA